MAYGQTFNGSLDSNSCVVSGSRADLYTFSAAAGDQIAVRTTDTAAALSARLELVNSAGAVIASSGTGDGANPRIPGVGSAAPYLTLAAAGTYTIRVLSSTGAAGGYTLSLYKAPPASSSCTYSLSSGRTFVPPTGGSFSFDVLTQPGCPPPSAPAAAGSIYTITAVNRGTISFAVSPNPGTSERVDAISVAGLTHAITQAANTAPSNDNFANAFGISGSDSPENAPVMGDTTLATSEAGEPSRAGSAAARSIWYRWTAPGTAGTTGGLYSFSTTGSSFDTVMAIYSCPAPGGTCTVANLTEIGSNDDTTAFDKTSKVNFRAAGGTVYYIAIDGKNGQSGTTQLAWRQYQRLYRLYLQNFNGNRSPLTPDNITASNGVAVPIRPTRISLGVYEFNLPADKTVYSVTITGPTGIVWNPGTFPLDTSFALLNELMDGPANGGQNTVSNAQNQTPRFIFGYIKNVTAAEVGSGSLKVKVGSSRGANPRDPVDCTPLGSTTIASVAYATYQCLTQPNTLHDVTPSMPGRNFTASVKSLNHYIDEDDFELPAAAFVAAASPTFDLSGRVLAGGAGTQVDLSYIPSGNTARIGLRTTTIDATGAYEFKNLAAGIYTLKATRAGFVYNQPAEINLTATRTAVDITAQSACTYQAEAAIPTIGSGGGDGEFVVQTGSTCEWAATSAASWITISSGAAVGRGSVQFTAAANGSATGRSGIIKVGGQDIIVQQNGAAAPTLGGLSPAVKTVGDADFDLTVSGSGFLAGAKVLWRGGAEKTPTSIASDRIVVRITSADLATAGVIAVKVVNPGVDTALGTSNSFNFTVNPCAYALSQPAQINFAAAGGVGSFTVTTTSGCGWTPQASDYCMIGSLSGGGAPGSGTVNFTVGVNAGVARAVTITAGGQSLTINQAAAAGGTRRAAFDYDGDGKSDISVYRPSEGAWYLQNSTTGFYGEYFGATGDKPVPADYDGDGKTDIAVYRAGAWFLQRSRDGLYTTTFGAAEDIPVPADYDGDGKADIAVYRPSQGAWYIFSIATGQFTGTRFGASEDKPVPADYDGDGKADIAVFRPSQGAWYLQQSSEGFSGMFFGLGTDKPIPADYDGDGRSDIAVYRNGVWYIVVNRTGFRGVNFGAGGDVPVPADYNGDRSADIAVYRPSDGVWYVWSCTSNTPYNTTRFGASTDTPTPNSFAP